MMREVKRSALVRYTPAQMFALVADFESYPQFLPWIVGAATISRDGNQMVGQLEMMRAGLRERIVTRNTLNDPDHLCMQLVDGPFKSLQGDWRFTSLTDMEGAIKGTRVELDIRFEFKNALLSMMLGRTFEASCGSMVDSFILRAHQLYGDAPS